jgi:predicted DNA repair protein MutK
MLWVGGGILVHGLEEFGFHGVPQLVEGLSELAHGIPGIGSVAAWLAFAAGSAVVGFIVGGAIVAGVHFLPKRRPLSDAEA